MTSPSAVWLWFGISTRIWNLSESYPLRASSVVLGGFFYFFVIVEPPCHVWMNQWLQVCNSICSSTTTSTNFALPCKQHYRCIYYYYPRCAIRQLRYLNIKQPDQLLVRRNCILINHGWAKRIMFNVFYMCGTWILSKCYKFYNLRTTLIFYILNVEDYNTEKHRCYRPKFSLINNYTGTLLNIILYWNGKVDSLSGSKLWKLLIISKNCSNKSCWKLNFVQKSQWAHMWSSKDCYLWNIIVYRNRKVNSL